MTWSQIKTRSQTSTGQQQNRTIQTHFGVKVLKSRIIFTPTLILFRENVASCWQFSHGITSYSCNIILATLRACFHMHNHIFKGKQQYHKQLIIQNVTTLIHTPTEANLYHWNESSKKKKQTKKTSFFICCTCWWTLVHSTNKYIGNF